MDGSGWLVQERKVIDFRGSILLHLGNTPTLKLFQIVCPVKKCDLLVHCREEIHGILNHMVLWKPNWKASKELLRKVGWNMIASVMMGTN